MKINKKISLRKLKLNLLRKNKDSDQKRDQKGKFTAGSGGLSKLQKFNWKRSAPIVVVVALVGGFLVYRSFAGVSPPDYQYSVSNCGGVTIKQLPGGGTEPTPCQDKSAEALVYRMQAGAFGRQPRTMFETGTQKLAGDRSTSTSVAQLMIGSPEHKWAGQSNKAFVEKAYTSILGKSMDGGDNNVWLKNLNTAKNVGERVSKQNTIIKFFAGLAKISEKDAQTKMYSLDNREFVQQIFRQTLKRGDSFVLPADNNFVKALDTNRVTRASALAQLAKAPEAINKNRAEFIAYVRANLGVKIKPVAEFYQKIRENETKKLADSIGKIYKDSERKGAEAKSYSAAARREASISRPGRSSLNTISNQRKAVESRYNAVAFGSGAARKAYEKANKYYEDAKKVSKHSPDLASDNVRKNRDVSAWLAALTKNKATEIKREISSIDNSYKVAERKYEAEQRRIAAQRAADAKRAAEAKRRRDAQRPSSGGGSGAQPSPAPSPNPGPTPARPVVCVDGYSVRGNGCKSNYKSPSGTPRCASGYPNLTATTSARLGRGATSYTVRQYFCKNRRGDGSRKFRSFPCPSGYKQARINSALYSTTCKLR